MKTGWEPELGDVIEPNFERHLEYKELMQRQTGLEVKVNG
jgi:hypothetical protein